MTANTDSSFFTIASPKNPLIKVMVANGHFTTSNAHISQFIDVSELKSNVRIAKNAARELALPYRARTLIDMIVCMEGMETIAAFLADELLQDGALIMNEGGEIHVVAPMSNAGGQLIFHQNVHYKINRRHILLMVASVSTGKTIRNAMECIAYYGGGLAGVSAIFSTVPEVDGREVNALFTSADLPNYHSYKLNDCALCKQGLKLDAIVNSEGFSRI